MKIQKWRLSILILKRIIYKIKKRVIKKLKHLKFDSEANLIFKSTADKMVFYDLYHKRLDKHCIIPIGIKTAGEIPIFIRNNDVDYSVIYSTFFCRYHLPPIKLKSNAVIVDLGSNIGLTIRHLKYLYPDSKIIGLEMECENYLIAKKNLDNIDNCILLNAAVWHRDGFVNYTGKDAQSFYCIDEDLNSNDKVKSYSLTRLFREYELSAIDFMKMDIEGAESIIFDKDCSWLNAVKSINIEVHHDSLSKYISVLEKYDFKCEVSKKHWSAILAYKNF